MKSDEQRGLRRGLFGNLVFSASRVTTPEILEGAEGTYASLKFTPRIFFFFYNFSFRIALQFRSDSRDGGYRVIRTG